MAVKNYTIVILLFAQVFLFIIYISILGGNHCHNIDITVTKDIDKLEQKPVLITASYKFMYKHLRNFVGSSILHESDRKIVVYDLGLSDEQRRELETIQNIKIIHFNFDKYPTHVKELSNFAWKPLVIQDALQNFQTIVYIDSGLEIISNLEEIDEILQKDGFYFVPHIEKDVKLLELTHEGMFSFLGEKPELFEKFILCSGEIQGYVRNSKAHHVLVCNT